MYSKQIYEPRKTFEILLSPEITPLPTKPLLSYYPLGIPQVWTMGYKDNTWFVEFSMVFLLKIWTYILAFPFVSQCPLLKPSKGHIKVLEPWCSSSGLTEILAACPLTRPRSSSFFFIIIIIIHLFFLLFGALGLYGLF